ncbi:MAG: hypothetical protein WC234_04540 [Endomicrobiaceae bacterium]
MSLLIIGGAVLIGTMLCKTARGMHADSLISKKELKEIEAKVKAFEQYIGLMKHTIDKAFKLETAVLENAKYQQNIAFQLLEKINEINDEKKLNFYFEQITCFVTNSMAIIMMEPKYFTKDLIEKINLTVPDFHYNSEIGLNNEIDESKLSLNNLIFSNNTGKYQIEKKN